MYSPKIKEDLIPILYRMAKEQGIAMTELVDRIIREALKIDKIKQCGQKQEKTESL